MLLFQKKKILYYTQSIMRQMVKVVAIYIFQKKILMVNGENQKTLVYPLILNLWNTVLSMMKKIKSYILQVRDKI